MRTFYRHYSDKREVLLGGTEVFEAAPKTGLDEQRATIGAASSVQFAVEAMSQMLRGRRKLSRRRQRIIDAHLDL